MENSRPYRTDQVEMTDEALARRLAELTEINQPWQNSPERIQHIKTEMALISMEQQLRYAERRPWDESGKNQE